MDILIKNGRIVDGTGNPWFYSDVLLSGGDITAVGRNLNVTADKVIDAEYEGGIYAHTRDLINEDDIRELGLISEKYRIPVHIPHINPPGKSRFKDLPIALENGAPTGVKAGKMLLNNTHKAISV